MPLKTCQPCSNKGASRGKQETNIGIQLFLKVLQSFQCFVFLHRPFFQFPKAFFSLIKYDDNHFSGRFSSALNISGTDAHHFLKSEILRGLQPIEFRKKDRVDFYIMINLKIIP